jgi:glycosyltransferase involved in cell wall biosynthesis
LDVSVIVRSKDEADRLKLALAALAVQTVRPEVIVVNDGSTDHTGDVLSNMQSVLPLVRIDHPHPLGRAAASNAGAAIASGEVLLFIDGDVLAEPGLVASHLELHRVRRDQVARGQTWHLRQTRHFLDPATGIPMPGEAERVSRMTEVERRAGRVTQEAVLQDFASIEARAQPAIYPGAGPRQLYDVELDALRSAPQCATLWAAASGQNQSVPRAAFLGAGGFDPGLDINEHRELALRLCDEGLSMTWVAGRSFHMTHRRGWRDPLADLDWMTRFHRAHPVASVALLPVLWGSLSDAPAIPPAARITSVPALAAAAARIRPGLTPSEVVAEHRRLTAGLEASLV